MKDETKIKKIENRMATLKHIKDFKIEKIVGEYRISFTYTEKKNISYSESIDDFIKTNIERLENDIEFLRGLLK